MSFDFRTAWDEVARPEFDRLYRLWPEMPALLTRVHAEAEGLHQNHNLDMPWPDSDLKQQFEALTDLQLAQMGHTVHSFGHWSYGDTLGTGLQQSGTYWKFAHYCDQVLRERLGLRRDPGTGPSNGFLINDGMLRYFTQSRHEWRWKEFGWATRENLAMAKDIAGEPCHMREGENTRQCRYRVSSKRLYWRIGMADPTSAIWLKAGERFVENPRGEELVLQDLRRVKPALPHWRVQELMSMNWVVDGLGKDEGHPFCIGSKHMTDHGLDTSSGCDFLLPQRNVKCKRPVEAHKCQWAVLLEGLGQPLHEKDPRLEEWLLALKKVIDDEAATWDRIVEGFAFSEVY